jgi:hypothetical protein
MATGGGSVRKLFKLRQWLTVEEAARHLSIVLGEEVSEADVLRLGLDRHLTLSVDFVNHAKAYLGRVLPYRDVPKREMPYMQPDGTPGPELAVWPDGYRIDDGEFTEDTRFVHLDHETARTIMGVWDLAMLGCERLDIEHRFQQLTDGPSVELVNLDGAFVNRPDGQWAQLLSRFKHRVEDTPKGKKTIPGTYYPAGGLPEDAVVVVRTDALSRFTDSLDDQSPGPARRDGELSTRERDTLLKLVIGMAVEAYRYDPEAARSPIPAEVASDLAKHGMSVTDDTIRKYLKEAAATVLPTKDKL